MTLILLLTLFIASLICFALNFVRVEVFSIVSIVALSLSTFVSLDYYFSGETFLPVSTLFYINTVNVHFLILTNAVGALIMVLSTRAVLTAHKTFYVFLNIIFLCLNAFFMSDNILAFYIFFEASAAPMFILIGLFGAGSTRHKAAYKFILYSLVGSTTLLPALVYLHRVFGDLSLGCITNFSHELSIEQMVLALAFFVPFSIKMPIMPFHLWLPEAHVEAPTSISVLLAGLLLKTGSFAFYLVVIYTFYQGGQLIIPIALFLGIFSVVASAFYALVQTDIKKLIAYSSVSHMSLVLVALFTLTELGFKGGYLFMLAHGINSAALFSIVGVLYDRGHVRIIRAYNGLVLVMPLLITIFFVMTLGNAGFPFTPGFFAEFFSFAGFTRKYPLASILAGVSIILSLIYSVWCFSRISFGNIRFLKHTQDLEKVELGVLLIYLYSFTLMGFNTDLVCSIFTQPQLAMSNSSVVDVYGTLDLNSFSSFLIAVFFSILVWGAFKPVGGTEKTAGISLNLKTRVVLNLKRIILVLLVIFFILNVMHNLFCIWFTLDGAFVEAIWLMDKVRPDNWREFVDNHRYYGVYKWIWDGKPTYEEGPHFYDVFYDGMADDDSIGMRGQLRGFKFRSKLALIKTMPIIFLAYYLYKDIKDTKLKLFNNKP